MADSIIHVLLIKLYVYLYSIQIWICACKKRVRFLEGTALLRCDIASEGIAVFQSEMFPLIAKRRRNFLKLILNAVCCNTFLTLWDLESLIFEVSFWAKALEP